MGVSPKRIGGWEPVETVDYEHDENGRVIRAIITREPEWDAGQIDLLLGLDALNRDTGSHGHLLSEATDTRADPNYYGADAIRFVAAGPFTDWAERARLDAIDAYKKSAGDSANLNGMFWDVSKKGFGSKE